MQAPEEKLVRLSVYRYIKSGKLAAIGESEIGFLVFDLSPSMDSITQFRIIQSVKWATMDETKHFLEVTENTPTEDVNIENFFDHINSFPYRYVRVLSSEDANIEKWKNTNDLNKLSVVAHDAITEEEYAWAGKAKGDMDKILLLGVALVLCAFFAISFFSIFGPLGTIISFLFGLLFIALFFALPSDRKWKWAWSKEADIGKLAELKKRKELLQKEHEQKKEAEKIAKRKALQDYASWVALTPYEFEDAIRMRLVDEGFKAKTTKASGDGGVDVEGVDADGKPVIVQAKQHKGKISVVTVREMIGVRESRDSKPRTIIYSLNGFTDGARGLAEKTGIELRDIKSELLVS